MARDILATSVSAALLSAPGLAAAHSTGALRRVLADRACNLHCCSDESAAAAAAGELGALVTLRPRSDCPVVQWIHLASKDAKMHRGNAQSCCAPASYSCGSLLTL